MLGYSGADTYGTEVRSGADTYGTEVRSGADMSDTCGGDIDCTSDPPVTAASLSNAILIPFVMSFNIPPPLNFSECKNSSFNVLVI